jgi:hypothetical protein
MEDDPAEKYTCLICFYLVLVPARCNICKKIYCKDCLQRLKDTNVNTCPLRCKNWNVENLNESEMLQYNSTIIKCTCCEETILLKHYNEHKVALESPHMCFNFRRCRRLSRYRPVGFDKPNFCSMDCYQFYWITKKNHTEFYEDLYQRFQKEPDHFEADYQQKTIEHPLESKDNLLEFDQENCPAEYSFPTPTKCVLSTNSRFFKTVYLKMPLLKSNFYAFNVNLESHQNFIKVGISRDNRKIESGAFCDDDYGIGFMTNGQTRHNNTDGSVSLFKKLNADIKSFFFQVDFISLQIVISLIPSGRNEDGEDDESMQRAELKIPEDWEMCFLAFAAKHNETITVS